MTTWDQIHKWTIYTLGLLVIWVLDAFILSRYPIIGITPVLLPLAAAAVAVLEGKNGGAGFALTAGLLWALTYPNRSGWIVLGLTLGGLAVGLVSQYVLSRTYPSFLLCSAALLGLLDGVHILWLLLFDSVPLAAMLRIAGLEILLSLCWSPLVYLIFWLIYRRVGGTRLA